MSAIFFQKKNVTGQIGMDRVITTYLRDDISYK